MEKTKTTLENGYYWIKPNRLAFKDKWVIATYENGMFWVHGTGEAFVPDGIEIDYKIERQRPDLTVPFDVSNITVTGDVILQEKL